MKSIYRYAPTNERQPCTVGGFEPILMRLTSELEVGYVPLTVVRFQARRFEPIGCTKPMVYAANPRSPRSRMRHDSIWRGVPMRASRYEVIAARATEPAHE